MIMKKNSVIIGAMAVALAALLWSLDGTFLRPRLYSLQPALLVFLEHLLGFVALLPFLVVYRAQLKLIKRKEWVAIFWVALFGGALGTIFITKALFATGFKDISVVILLQKFQPIFAIILAAIFLRERFPRSFYFYAPLALVAGYFVTFKNPFAVSSAMSAVPIAAGFSMLAAFAWGSATTFGKYSLKNISYGLLAALRFGLTVLIMAIPAARYFSSLPSVGAAQWTTLIIIVFTSGAAAMFLYYFGLKKITASVATLCELSWPVSAIILDYYLNGNALSATQILGAAALAAAVTRIVFLHRSRVVAGAVLPGYGQGDKVGIHTANLDVALAKNLPRGLYTCSVAFIANTPSFVLPLKRGGTTDSHPPLLGEGQGKGYSGLLYYGYNSLTKKDCLEVHVLNFAGDLYGKKIEARTERYLRLPKKFDSVESLAAQVAKDLKLVSE
ncbi:hypothetical protein EPN28_01850 [Patescibacteria group bacterium]|nr:MAG: hypothetical protein EPN28_01850 [Patescibacteria group bacterium]